MSLNPFGVYNPEQLDADYIARNFVDVYTDLPALRDKSNTFILGARGTGKSMLLRSLEPAVMVKAGKVANIGELPYLAVHVPLKKAEFAVPELSRLAGYASVSLGEHLLVMHAMYRLTGLLVTLADHISSNSAQTIARRFDELLAFSAGELPSETHPKSAKSSLSAFSRIQRRCEQEIMRVRQYFARLAFTPKVRAYTGPLTGFLDFMVPISEHLRTVDGLPKVPVFLMLDDADNLPRNMQRVLNSWISTRSTHAICLKVTTQLGYATLRTVDNRIIESPHDYAEVNLASVYTTDQDRYSNRVREIVVRRLSNAGIDASPEAFFPRDERQAARIKEIEEEIRIEWETRQSEGGTGRRGPARPRDDVIRYAVPRLMRELAGSSRSSHTFSYAGFKSLVDLSAGVVRWFLEPASRMYDRVAETGAVVTTIPVSIQNEIVRDWSREFVSRLHSLSSPGSNRSVDDASADPDASLHALGHETVMYERLKNIIDALGRLFREKLLDPNASEQRVFSIVVRGPISEELKQVLGLAVRLGYLQTSDNSAKEPLGGRLPRFVLARRLGPYYRLDVSGYAAHLSVMAQDLAVAMRNPSEFVASRLRQGDDRQFSLELGRGDADVFEDRH